MHHLLIFFGGCIGLEYRCQEYFYCSFGMAELSTVFLSVKDVARTVFNYRSKTFEATNLALFAASFFVFRIWWLPTRHITEFMSYWMCGDAAYRLPLILNCLSIPISLLSYYWFFIQISPMIRFKLTAKKSAE